MYVKNALIQILELRHRELLGKQFKADWLEMDLLLEFLDCLAKDHVMVKGQLRNVGERKPIRLGRFVSPVHLGDGIVDLVDALGTDSLSKYRSKYPVQFS